jgi:hypothetical protein
MLVTQDPVADLGSRGTLACDDQREMPKRRSRSISRARIAICWDLDPQPIDQSAVLAACASRVKAVYDGPRALKFVCIWCERIIQRTSMLRPHQGLASLA